MSANGFKTFFTTDNTSTYVSSPLDRESERNRTCVFQANINTGDTVVLQGQIDESMPFVNILTATDENILQEVVTVAQFRVSVTNTSGQAVVCALAS